MLYGDFIKKNLKIGILKLLRLFNWKATTFHLALYVEKNTAEMFKVASIAFFIRYFVNGVWDIVCTSYLSLFLNI
jgi:hypothetical protein